MIPDETIEIGWNLEGLTPRRTISVTLRRASRETGQTGAATAVLDTAREVGPIQAGGIIALIPARALVMPKPA